MTAVDVCKYLHWTYGTCCKNAVDFGFVIDKAIGISAPDGHKAVCLDPGVTPVYNDCLVYTTTPTINEK